MTLAAPSSASGHPDVPRPVVVWHLAWAAVMALVTLAALMFRRELDLAVLIALVAAILPGLGGLLLLRRDGWAERVLLLGGWSLATVAVSALSGGMTGALAGLTFMPVAAGIVLGGRTLAQGGGVAVGLAALVGLVSVWLGGPGDSEPVLAAVVAVLAAAALATAIGLSWGPRDIALSSARDGLGRVETLLAGQPGLTLVLQPSGQVLGAYGSAPPAIDVESLFEAGLIAAVHAPDRSALLAALEKAAEGHEAQVSFAPRQALDRRVTLVLRRLDGEGETVRLIGQAFDGTPQFARESGLETARAEAEAQNAGKSRFLANMSHELRTPLNAVIGFSDIMRQRLFGPLPEKYAGYADSIHEAGGHLLDLINDVLDMSKIEAERYELSVETFDAREVVSAAIALVRVGAIDKGVTLQGVLPMEALTVDADRRALKQIALNLLSNAIKFTPVDGSVTVTLDAIGPYLELVVSDTGVGIAPEDLRRLGRPFEQAGAADQKAQGTGLGLSLVRALAELHGGRMSIDSTLGEGTAITVRLPVVNIAKPAVPEGGAEIIPLRPKLVDPSPSKPEETQSPAETR
ncbi:cell cycle sensor histidine kinase DivJ [soil metagenome]